MKFKCFLDYHISTYVKDNTMQKIANSNLHDAKKNKKDEFYTQLSDIENELQHYKEHFKDKIVYCNCDEKSYKECR